MGNLSRGCRQSRAGPGRGKPRRAGAPPCPAGHGRRVAAGRRRVLLPSRGICGKTGEEQETEKAMPDYASRRKMMVDTQVRPSDVTKYPIIQAMLTVPRETFVPVHWREAAYAGANVDLGGGRVVLDPRTLAKMLDALDIQPDELVLDLGCGLGYSTAIIARLAEAVVGIEENEEFAREAQAALSEQQVDNAVVTAGPMAAGDARHGPYDVITLQGGVEVVPEPLIAQLKDGGRIGAIFMEGALGICRIGYKIDGRVTWRDVFNAAAPVMPGFRAPRGFVL